MTAPARVALITGAARGIGAGVARRLHRDGWHVVLVGLEPQLLAALADELGEGRVAWHEADVTDLDALLRIASDVASAHGGLDAVVANAGIHYIAALESAPASQVARVIDVNLNGAWHTAHAFLPLLAQRRGYLLAVASLSAALRVPLMAPYAASKAGVEALCDVLRLEVASRGVGVGCALFGFIETDLVRRSFEHPATASAGGLLPAFASRPVPVERAVSAIVRGIERRSSRVYAPRFARWASWWRMPLQRLLERRITGAPQLDEALSIAADHEQVASSHELLGIAVPAATRE